MNKSIKASKLYFQVVKDNIKKLQEYLLLYPDLKRYKELGNKSKLTDEESQEYSPLWDTLIKLKIHIISHYSTNITKKAIPFLIGGYVENRQQRGGDRTWPPALCSRL